MQGTLDLTDAVSLGAILINLLLLVQLYLFKKPMLKADKFFAFFLVSSLWINIFFVLLDFRFNKFAAFTLPLLIGAATVLSPLMFLHLSTLIFPSRKIGMKKHFIVPISLALIFGVVIYTALLGNDLEMKIFLIDLAQYLLIFVFGLTFIVQNVIYIWKSIRLYSAHKKNIAETLSYQEFVSLSWIKIYIIGYLLFVIGMIGVNLTDNDASNLVHDLVFIVYLSYVGIQVFRQQSVYPENIDTNEIKETEIESLSEKNSELFEKIKADLLYAMEENEAFLDHNLSIFSLAKNIQTNSNYLSHVVNKELNTSFVHFVNSYRVKKAKELLLDEKFSHFTIESIGFEAGFKSKSTFNTAFKKWTGTTPSEFIKINEQKKVSAA